MLGFRCRVLISLFCTPNCAPLGEYFDSSRNEIVVMKFFYEFHSRCTGKGRAPTPSPYDLISSH
jgi:hypothetical protein